MSRGYRLAAIISLAALLSGAVPASAASVGSWSLFGSFSPFDWIWSLWADEGTQISPGGRPGPIPSSDKPRGLWGEEGGSINPWGQPAPASQNTWTGIDPWGLQ
jgi:hypothetical protein